MHENIGYQNKNAVKWALVASKSLSVKLYMDDHGQLRGSFRDINRDTMQSRKSFVFVAAMDNSKMSPTQSQTHSSIHVFTQIPTRATNPASITHYPT